MGSAGKRRSELQWAPAGRAGGAEEGSSQSCALLGGFKGIQHGDVLSSSVCRATRCEGSSETQSTAGLGGLWLLDEDTFPAQLQHGAGLRLRSPLLG